MVDTPEDTPTAAEQLTVSPTGVSAGPEEKRRRWLLLTALALVFLAASVLVLGLALRGSGAGSGEVTASGRAAAASGKPERTAEPTEAAADEAGQETPETTEPPPKALELPFEWSAEGLVSLPFGTQRDEAIEAVSAALDSPPDEVTVNEQSECTPGTSARWEADNVRLSMDEAGNLASASFPAELGSVDGVNPAATLGIVRDAFPQVSLEYRPAEPDFGEYEDSYRWTVQSAEANVSGNVGSENDQAAFEMTWLRSERYQGVKCYE